MCERTHTHTHTHADSLFFRKDFINERWEAKSNIQEEHSLTEFFWVVLNHMSFGNEWLNLLWVKVET